MNMLSWGLPLAPRKSGASLSNPQEQLEAPLTKDILKQLKGSSKKENYAAAEALRDSFIANIPSDGALKCLGDSGALSLIVKHALKGLKVKRVDEAGVCLQLCGQFVILTTQRNRPHALRLALIDAIVHSEIIKVAACLAFQAPQWGLRVHALRILMHLANAEELVPAILELIVEKSGPLTEPANCKLKASSVKLISLVDAIVHYVKEASDLGSAYHHQDVPIHGFVELGLRLLRGLAYCEAAASVLIKAGVVQVCVPLLANENPLNCSVVAGSCVANLSGRDASLAHHLKTVEHRRPWNIVPRLCFALAQTLIAKEESFHVMDESPGTVVQLLYTVHSLSAVQSCVSPLLDNKVLVSLEFLLRSSCGGTLTDPRVNRQVQLYVSQILLKLAGAPLGPTKILVHSSLVELILACRRGRGINSGYVQANFTRLHRLLKQTQAALLKESLPPLSILLAFTDVWPGVKQLREILSKKGMLLVEVSLKVAEEADQDAALPSDLASVVEAGSLVLLYISSQLIASDLARKFCNYVYITRKPMIGFASGYNESLDWLDILLEDELLLDVSQGFEALLSRAQELLQSKEDEEEAEEGEAEGFPQEIMSSVALINMFAQQITATPSSEQDDMEEDKENVNCQWDSTTQICAARLLERYLQRLGSRGADHVEKLGAIKLKQLLLRQFEIEKTSAKLEMKKTEITAETVLDISREVADLLCGLKPSFLSTFPASWEDLACNLWPGDILLFQTKTLVSKMIRVVTGSKYDHVAVVQRRDRNGRIHLLQAFYDTGVVVTSLDLLRCSQPARYFERVVVRQVQPALPIILKRGLVKFSKSVQGSPYGINPIKLARRSTMALEKKESIGDKRTYFCSELIAAAWRSIGLIDSEKSSARYYPADFSSVSSLKMAEGWSLGPEIPIDLGCCPAELFPSNLSL